MKQKDFSCFNTSIAVSFKQNRHPSELEEYRSGANSNDVAKDGAAMHTDRRYLYQRALTRPVYQRLEEENLHIFGGHGIMGVVPFNKMNGAELTETIKQESIKSCKRTTGSSQGRHYPVQRI